MNTRRLKHPWAGGACVQVRAQPFSIAHGLHLPELFGGKGRERAEMPLEGWPNHASAPTVAQLHLSDGQGRGAAARMVAVSQNVPAAAECGKPQQFQGFSSSSCLLGSAFSQIGGKDNTTVFPGCRQELG